MTTTDRIREALSAFMLGADFGAVTGESSAMFRSPRLNGSVSSAGRGRLVSARDGLALTALLSPYSVPEQRRAGPDPRAVAELTAVLDLLANFTSNEQRARYLLSSNFMRDHGAAAARHACASFGVTTR